MKLQCERLYDNLPLVLVQPRIYTFALVLGLEGTDVAALVARHSHLLSHVLTRLAVVPGTVKVARLKPLNLVQLNCILSCDLLDKPATGFVAMFVCDIHEELDLLIDNDFDDL